jgi:hypothetical protein
MFPPFAVQACLTAGRVLLSVGQPITNCNSAALFVVFTLATLYYSINFFNFKYFSIIRNFTL